MATNEDMLNEDIDDFPAELWPLQKSKNRPFDFATLSDARNNGFSEYAFALAWKGYTIEQIQSTIQGINDFVLETGLRCGEVDTILREETLEKLRNIINQKEEKNLSPVAVANELLEQHHLIYLNSNLYAYQNGVYIKKTKLFASGLFKALVGGDAVRIEQKYREAFDYVFTGKMIFGMNLFPDFSADFEGIERRLVILKFERVYKPTDPDYNPNIDDDLSTNEAMSALLNRAISGYKSLIQNKGFLETQKSKQQMAAFVSENDSVVAWVESLDDVGILEREPISGPEGLYKAYETRCNTTGERAKDQKDFTRIIKTRYGYETARKRINGKQYPMFINN